MNIRIKYLLKWLPVLAVCFFFSCKKEHLEPNLPPGGTPEPLVYIRALIDNDSVNFAGGLNSYIGATAVFDTLTHRTFNFSLKNPQQPAQSFFQISINSYKDSLGIAQNDLDSTLYIGTRQYQQANHPFATLSATLTWTDSSGFVFSSSNVPQSNLFSITHVQDVVFDSKNYKKAVVEFECLIASVHDTLHVTNGKAVILFSVN